VKELFVSAREISVINDFFKFIPVPTQQLTLSLGERTIFKDEDMRMLIEKVNSFDVGTLIFKMTTNLASFYPYFDQFHAKN
jgi:hypothetical protein